MIDDFEAVLLSDDPAIDEEPERPAPRPDDDPDGWLSGFRSQLDDPE